VLLLPQPIAGGNVICKLIKCKHIKINQLQFQGLGRHTLIKDARSSNIKTKKTKTFTTTTTTTSIDHN